jgi:type IV secretion system protein TrbL
MPRSHKRILFSLSVAPVIVGVMGSPSQAAPGKCDVLIIDPLCEVGKTVAGKAKDVFLAPFRSAANGAVEMVTSWVADAAKWILMKVINFIDNSTSPALDAAWFTERYRFMIGLAALVVLPLLLIATIRAVVKQDPAQLVRSFFVFLPVAILGTFVAVYLTQSLLAITDAMSATVSDRVAGDVSEIFDGVGETLSGSVGAVNPAAPSFAIFFVALLLIIGSFFVWIELLIRSAAVTVAVFFLPLILAGLVWPATTRWTKRLVEILVALILSKFVVVAVISLATAALADPGSGGFGAVMGGAALMLMAAFAPFVLLRLMPAVEGAAVDSFQSLGRGRYGHSRSETIAHHAMQMMRRGRGGASRSQPLAVAGSAGAASATGVGTVVATTANRAKNVGERSVGRAAQAPDDKGSSREPGRPDATSKRPSAGGVSTSDASPKPRKSRDKK